MKNYFMMKTDYKYISKGLQYPNKQIPLMGLNPLEPIFYPNYEQKLQLHFLFVLQLTNFHLYFHLVNILIDGYILLCIFSVSWANIIVFYLSVKLLCISPSLFTYTIFLIPIFLISFVQ